MSSVSGTLKDDHLSIIPAHCFRMAIAVLSSSSCQGDHAATCKQLEVNSLIVRAGTGNPVVPSLQSFAFATRLSAVSMRRKTQACCMLLSMPEQPGIINNLNMKHTMPYFR